MYNPYVVCLYVLSNEEGIGPIYKKHLAKKLEKFCPRRERDLVLLHVSGERGQILFFPLTCNLLSRKCNTGDHHVFSYFRRKVYEFIIWKMMRLSCD